MGTLFEQPPRNEAVSEHTEEDVFSDISHYQKYFNISFEKAVSLIRLTDELNINRHKLHDMDVRDEQLAGIGEMLDRINVSLNFK